MTAEAFDWKAWRRGERERLIAERLALGVRQRELHAGDLIEHLERLLSPAPGRIVSFYWPFRGEPNLVPWMRLLHERGVVPALPVVVARRQPMLFRRWAPGAPMERGIWNIPVPTNGADVLPDIVIAPLVGFDSSCYRLGYGGGYFDRTLAALGRPRAVGVGYPHSRLATVHPQPHDIPMDAVVTGEGVWVCEKREDLRSAR